MSMKLLLILPLTLLWSLAFVPTAFAVANETPDFSVFDDPNVAMPTDHRSNTQAEPPCTTCGRNLRPQNHRDIEAVTKKDKASTKKSTAKKKAETQCVTCGRVSIDQVRNQRSEAGKSVWDQYPQ